MRRSVSSILLCTTVLAFTGAPTAVAAEPTAIVALGDSYISGEAGRWEGNSNTQTGDRDGTDRAAEPRWWGWSYDAHRVYGDSYDNGCNRSDVAEIASAGIAVDAAVNLACSGAETQHVLRAQSGGVPFKEEPPQADQLADVAASYDVELVVLSIGGNDLGFADIIADCATRWSTSSSSNPDYCYDDQQPLVDQRMPAAMDGVRQAIEDIQFVLRHDDGFRFVLQSYPSPIPRGAENRYPESGWDRLDTGGCPFWNADSDWARDSLTSQIADELAGVAAQAGVEFLDLRDFLQGREVCSTATTLSDGSPTAVDQEWVRFLVSGWGQGDQQESFHPNAFAQRALGGCVNAVWAAAPGDYACHNVAGQGSGSVTLSALP